MKQQRIGIILPDLRAGGGVALYLGLAKRLRERGRTVDLVLLSVRGEYKESIPVNCLIFSGSGARTDQAYEEFLDDHRSYSRLALSKASVLAAQIELRWQWRHAGLTPGKWRMINNGEIVRHYINRCKPNAVLGGSTEANWATILGGTRASIAPRTVVTVHTNYELGRSAKMTRCCKLLYPKADWVVGVSRGATECAARTLELGADRTTHIYNGYPIGEIQKKAEDRHGPGIELQQFGVPVVLSIARQSTGGAKDLDTLIKAFAVFRKHQESKLVLVRPGKFDPDETCRLQSLVTKLQVTDDVIFHGFTENPYSLMKHASVLVLSSHWEGCPNVLIEAMACGTPVVSTDTPFGPAEILDCGRYGKLVPVGDVDQMAAAIAAGRRGHPSVAQLQARAAEFSIERMTTKYENLLLGT